jgi:hypothetical protein
VGPAHDEDDGEEAGERQWGEDRARRPEPPGTLVPAVEVDDDAVGVDGRDRPVEEGDDVAGEDPDEDGRLEEDAEQVDAVARREAERQREEQEGRGGERHGAVPGPRVGVPEAGEDERQERGGEGGAGAASRLLRACHRG